jgi:steroid delta-isomerase-like uncharacterized protein
LRHPCSFRYNKRNRSLVGERARERRIGMSAEENKAMHRRLMEEAFSQGNMDVVDEIIAPDYVHHFPDDPEGGVRGPEGMKDLMGSFRSAFPDIQATIEEQVAEEDKMVMRYTARGTHEGELQGIPPTSRRVTVMGVVMSRTAGGKMVESWELYDNLGMMQQLGLAPEQ